MKLSRGHYVLAVFVAAYLAAAAVAAIAQGNTEFLFYLLVMGVLIAFVVVMHARVGFSIGVLWALAVWGLLHLAGGTVPIPESLTDKGGMPVLYSLRIRPWLPRYDQVVHAFGFCVATFAGYEALRAAVAGKGGRLRVTPGIAFACLCIGVGLGALNEVIEFTATLFMETNVGDYQNTGWDLVANLTGALVATLVVWQRHRQPVRGISA